MVKYLIGLLLLSSSHAITVTATAYSMTGRVTATGSYAGKGQIAVSRDLLRMYPYGSYVKLVAVKGSNCGGFSTATLKVTDTMARNIYRTVDVHLPSTRSARMWGKCNATLLRVK